MKRGRNRKRQCIWQWLLLSGLLATAAEPGTTQAQQAAAAASPPAVLVPPAMAPINAPLVLRGAMVLDVQSGRWLPEQTVVIAGTRIQTMGRTGQVRVPRRARVIEAHGTYLLPGFWDMHVHPLRFGNIGYPLFLANGITGVRDAGSNVPLATLTHWKREIAQGTRAGPRVLVSGPSINEMPPSRPHQISVTTREAAAQGVDTARARWVVDSLHEAGADFIKPYDMSEGLYFIIAAEARRLGMPFGGHPPHRWVGDSARWSASAPNPDIGLRLSDSGARFLDHGYSAFYPEGICGGGDDTTQFDAAGCAALAQHYRRNNTWVVMGIPPTTFPRRTVELWRRYCPADLLDGRDSLYGTTDSRDSAFRYLRTSSNFARLAPRSFADWMAAYPQLFSAKQSQDAGWRRSFWARLEAAGMPLLTGTDAVIAGGNGVPGFALHETLADYVLFGMSPLGALRTVTLNPALALKATDSLGTVAAGKLADLVLLDADPLQDIWNTTKIRAVVANGRYYGRAALDGLLVAAERAAHQTDTPMSPSIKPTISHEQRVPRKHSP